MTLVDYETRKHIINPYITLKDGGNQKWASLNTETFGEVAQRELISLHNEQTLIALRERKTRLYEVIATIGKQNNLLD